MRAKPPSTSSSKRRRFGLSRTLFCMPASSAPPPARRGAGSHRAAIGNLADPRIAGKDELARSHRGGLEIRVVGRKNLPLRRLLAEDTNRAHPWEFLPQARVMLHRGSQPDTVVRTRL